MISGFSKIEDLNSVHLKPTSSGELTVLLYSFGELYSGVQSIATSLPNRKIQISQKLSRTYRLAFFEFSSKF